jgi:hypothetical protein
MSDVPTGTGPRGATADGGVPTRPLDPAPFSDAPGGSDPSAADLAMNVAQQGKQSAAQAADEVKGTAKEQAQRVVQEAGAQTRGLASDVRDRIGEQARAQNDRLVGTIRETADQLDEMRGDHADSPAAAMVSRVADGGRQFADYLDRHGPDGVLREVQDFARRRPGAFLATALAAGFVVGRLGKGVAKADSGDDQGKPGTDAFTSHDSGTTAGDSGTTAGYEGRIAPTTVATEYAATGGGAPMVVAEDYVADLPPVDRTGGAR